MLVSCPIWALLENMNLRDVVLSKDNFENTTFHISCKIKRKLYFTLRINNHRGKGQKLVGLWQTGPLLVSQFSNIFCRFKKEPALYL